MTPLDRIEVAERFRRDVHALVDDMRHKRKPLSTLAVVVFVAGSPSYEEDLAQIMRSSGGQHVRRMDHGAVFPCGREYAIACAAQLMAPNETHGLYLLAQGMPLGDIPIIYVHGSNAWVGRHRTRAPSVGLA